MITDNALDALTARMLEAVKNTRESADSAAASAQKAQKMAEGEMQGTSLTGAEKKLLVQIDLKAADAAQYIYMVPKGTAGTSDKYDEYMVIDGVLEKMGDWKVDLSGYVQKEAGKGLSTNDYTSADKQKVTNMEKTMDARITASMATDTEVNAMLDELFGS